MTNKEILKKQIIYRANHRGTKEMDTLLGSFVKKHIQNFSEKELSELKDILYIEDEILYNWYFNKEKKEIIPKNNVSELLKKFKL